MLEGSAGTQLFKSSAPQASSYLGQFTFLDYSNSGRPSYVAGFDRDCRSSSRTPCCRLSGSFKNAALFQQMTPFSLKPA